MAHFVMHIRAKAACSLLQLACTSESLLGTFEWYFCRSERIGNIPEQPCPSKRMMAEPPEDTYDSQELVLTQFCNQNDKGCPASIRLHKQLMDSKSKLMYQISTRPAPRKRCSSPTQCRVCIPWQEGSLESLASRLSSPCCQKRSPTRPFTQMSLQVAKPDCQTNIGQIDRLHLFWRTGSCALRRHDTHRYKQTAQDQATLERHDCRLATM